MRRAARREELPILVPRAREREERQPAEEDDARETAREERVPEAEERRAGEERMPGDPLDAARLEARAVRKSAYAERGYGTTPATEHDPGRDDAGEHGRRPPRAEPAAPASRSAPYVPTRTVNVTVATRK